VLRLVYIWILRLHPQRFRRRFAKEMLYVFDQARQHDTAEALTSAKLLGDGLLSLMRQWALRSEFWKDRAGAGPTQVPDGVPAFCVLDGFRPRSSALIHGVVLSVAIFCAVIFAMKYSIIHQVYFAFPVVDSDDRASGPQLQRAIIPTVTDVGPDQGREKTVAPPPRSVGRGATSEVRPEIEVAQASRTVPPHSKRRLKRNLSSKREVTEKAAEGTVMTGDNSAERSLAQASPPVMLSDELLDSYTGAYVTLPPEQLRVSVTLMRGTLRIAIAGKPQMEMEALSESKFVCRTGNKCWAEFSRNRDGTVQLEIYHRGRRTSAYRQ